MPILFTTTLLPMVIFIFGFLCTQEVEAQPTTYLVNTAGDDPDPNAGENDDDGLCDVNLGMPGEQCTLRAAIENHNANIQDNQGNLIPNTINFDIPPPALIQVVGEPLPIVFGKLHIDGTTQPGYNGDPLIEIDGSMAGNDAVGLWLVGLENIVEGLNIHSFSAEGMILSRTTDHLIQDNYIGTDITGTMDKGNGEAGILVLETSDNTIMNNVISGNGGAGIEIDGGDNNDVHGNHIGVDKEGENAIPNDEEGILIHNGAESNTIGNQGNIISGNVLAGILIMGVGTDNNLVRSNNIGVDEDGNTALGNGIGVQISQGAQSNEIGGSLAGQGNLISGNVEQGVLITDGGTNNNRVQDNTIGANQSRSAALPNGTHGVAILNEAQNNVVTDNTIEGNTMHGVLVSGGGTNSNAILANFIGSASLPNQEDGIRIADGAQINNISQNNVGNNTQNGVTLTGNGTEGNTVAANFIIGNEESGVVLDDGATLNFVGGFIVEAKNVIQGNLESGVVVSGGVINTIMNNEISFNNFAGVAVVGGTGNAIRMNAIFSNISQPVPTQPLNGLGIDLGGSTAVPGDNGVTPNDPGDADSGPNNLQNFPVLTAVSVTGGNTTIEGTLNSTPNTTFILDFFSNSTADPTGFGEGQNFLGANQVTTNNSGDVAFSFTFNGVSVPQGFFVTATATSQANNTSEFSAALPLGVPQAADLALTKVADQPSYSIGDVVTFTITLTNGGPDQATGVVVTDVLPLGITFDEANATVGSYDETTGLWSVGSLNNGSQAVLTLVGNTTQEGTFTNTAELTASDQADPDSAPANGNENEDDQSSVSIEVTQVADLALNKEANQDSFTVGDQVTFTITLTNEGPDEATGIAVTDLLPAGIIFDQANTTAGSYDETTGVWTINSLSNGSQAVLTLVGTTTMEGTFTNTAEVTASDQADPDSSPGNGIENEDDQSSASIEVTTADNVEIQLRQLIAQVEALVEANQLGAVPGNVLIELLDFTIELNNAGQTQAAIGTLKIFILVVKALVIKKQILPVHARNLMKAAADIIKLLRESSPLAQHPMVPMPENEVFVLHPNYPNPFHRATVISFTMTMEEHVHMRIFDERNGRSVELLNQRLPEGKHQVTWEPDHWTSGLYLLQIKSGNMTETQRLVLVK